MTFLNRHRWAVLAAVLSVLMAIALTAKAFARFRDDPFPLWMTDASRWYDEAMGAAVYGVAAIASVVHLVRRWRAEGAVRPADAAVRPARWRQRAELRVVLYCVAAVSILQFPLGVIQTVRAMDGDPPPFGSSFVSLFPVGGWMFPLIGTAIVVYDRRRITRESREDSGACLNCGYDLRASTDRCPECGSPIPATS